MARVDEMARVFGIVHGEEAGKDFKEKFNQLADNIKDIIEHELPISMFKSYKERRKAIDRIINLIQK